MAYEKIVSVFDTEAHAKAASKALEAEGFSASDISILGQQALRQGDDPDNTPGRETGFWKRLFGGEVHEHEAEVFGRTVEAGGYVLTLRVPDSDVDRAMKVLDAHQPIDVQERAGEYGLDTKASPLPTTRSVGTGLAAGVAGAAAGAGNAIRNTAGSAVDAVRGTGDRVGAGGDRAADRAGVTGDGPAADPARMPAAGVTGNRAAGDEEVIRLAEEQINVGKRQVEAGTTRIRRFVTEKPVEAQVTLHEEHAEVVRRAVTDPSFLNDVDWSDQTIEVREMAEEAVVSKSTRLAEEVVVRKEGTDRTETVHDKVRRQQVEVEHLDNAAKTATNKP